MRKTWMTIGAMAIALMGATGCSTWDRMSKAEKGAVIGAGAGALVGNNVGSGGTGNTLGGAAIGGAVGYGIGSASK